MRERMLPNKQIAQLLSTTILASIASAAEPQTASPTPEPRFKISGWIDSGVTFNPDSPRDNQNFGRLFDDRANEPMLNQLVINFERALAPKPGEIDWGFKLQLMCGSDARFIHSLGLFDRTAHEIIQPDLVEAYLSLHFPFLTERGLDLKVGKFVTLEGAETIDPRTNFFYSHTYIFNFGIPFNHTGALATLHATNWLDVMAGVTGGVNISIDDNNDAPAFHGGVGLNLYDGKVVVAASTHIGPETRHNNHDVRYLNDITTTWKISGKLTSITDLNHIYDEAADATGYGVAQYFIYTINDLFSVGVRGEIWRDDNGFYVASFAENDDVADGLRGGSVTFDPRTVGGGKTTYGAVTLALNIKPVVPKPAASLVVRPELRFDSALNGTRPFSDSSERNQFTAGIDFIIGF
ncbi:MAG: porin [Verrucomicrobiota bacterium]|nr:porin [Verrucomicrobiota bacterium]